jgi:hypothetical protein
MAGQLGLFCKICSQPSVGKKEKKHPISFLIFYLTKKFNFKRLLQKFPVQSFFLD